MIYPYILKIEAYNEAGERVRVIADTMASMPATGITALVSGTASDIFNTSAGSMDFRVTGTQAPGQGSSTYVQYPWDGRNANGQEVDQGVYYIKVSETDEFGHTITFIKDITLVRLDEYVELDIFNSAGELVRSIRKDAGSFTGKAQLTVPDTLIIQDDGSIVDLTGSPSPVKYGNDFGESIVWDGRDASGTMVSNGSYEMQVIIKTPDGVSAASKTILVLRQDKKYLDKFIIQPDPFDKNASAAIIFRWTFTAGSETGTAIVKVYDISGGLVKTLSGDLASAAGLTWDLKSGEKPARGLYVCVLETRNSTGYMDRKIAKLAIMGYR
jgi:flagellar hook assembly protein FlgD